MKKGVLLAAAACALWGSARAQVADTLQTEADNADFTFTESQLDEDNDQSQAISTVVSSRSNPYSSEVGYRFSPMRFRQRAYENTQSQTYMQGLLLNDAERGSFSYGLIGGMNDATRNREGVGGYEFNQFALTGLGGAENINTRASAFAQGSKLALSGTNRNYVLRGMLTHATGWLPGGWAFAGSVGYRWAKEGVIEGTFYNSFSYFLAAEKKLSEHHSLSLVTFGAPTKRGQQGASTEEAYWLANSHYYNPNWGYQDGKKRNARIVHSFEPTAILTWDWRIADATKLTTSLGFRYSKYASTALGWNGDAYDPRPDYWKNFPSSVFNVYDESINNGSYLQENPYLLDQYQTLYDYWTSDKANRQVNWDRMYYVNRTNEAGGGETLYYQENRHNDQRVFSLSSTFNHAFNRHHRIDAGLQASTTKGMHYKTMYDLLGGTRYTDIDKFAANDYGINSLTAQNDLRHPNRQISKGDKFGYNYNIFVNQATLWAQYQATLGHFVLNVGSHADGTTIERDGLMQNGRAPENSYGRSGKAKFLGGGAKAALAFITPHGRITLSGRYDATPPLARNAFVAPRIQNNFVDNLKLEHLMGAELAWNFRYGPLSGVINGYYTRTTHGVEQTAFYNDQEERFTYLTMSGVKKRYYGVEAAFVYQITSNLSVNLMGTISEAEYTGNPRAQINYEGMDAATIAQLNQGPTNPVTGVQMPLRVIANGMHVNGTPLSAASLGVNYNIKGWFLEANLNYYARVYVDFSEYRRLNATYANASTPKLYTPTSVDAEGNMTYAISRQELLSEGGILFDALGNIVKERAAHQEKFDGGFMLDLSIGRYIRLKHGRSLSLNLNLNNVTNNRNLRTGGYEQSRDDFYNTGTKRSYLFSRNSKYYYANAFNFFLNIGLRF